MDNNVKILKKLLFFIIILPLILGAMFYIWFLYEASKTDNYDEIENKISNSKVNTVVDNSSIDKEKINASPTLKELNDEFDKAVEKAAALANMDLSKMCQSKTISFLRRLKLFSQKPIEHYQHPILPKSDYTKFSKEKVPEWLNEGIKQEVMDLFGVRVDKQQNRIIYPVYDIHGNLINIKARTRYKNYKELKLPKYINYHTVGVMDYFQGLNITLPFVKEQNEIIIFESVKSVMKAYGWGYKNCASAEKHTLTEEQIALLVKLRVNIVFAYDSDVNYRNKDVKHDIDILKRVTNVYIIDDNDKLLGGAATKNAPVDLGQDIWEELYETKRKVV